MIELVLDQMIDELNSVLVELRNEQAQVQIAVLNLTHSEVVAFGQNVNAMRKLALTTDMFFKRNKINSNPKRVKLIEKKRPSLP